MDAKDERAKAFPKTVVILSSREPSAARRPRNCGAISDRCPGSGAWQEHPSSRHPRSSWREISDGHSQNSIPVPIPGTPNDSSHRSPKPSRPLHAGSIPHPPALSVSSFHFSRKDQRLQKQPPTRKPEQPAGRSRATLAPGKILFPGRRDGHREYPGQSAPLSPEPSSLSFLGKCLPTVRRDAAQQRMDAAGTMR